MRIIEHYLEEREFLLLLEERNILQRLMRKIKRLDIKYKRWISGRTGLPASAGLIVTQIESIAAEAKARGASNEYIKKILLKRREVIKAARVQQGSSRKLIIRAGVLPPVLATAAGVAASFFIANHFYKKQQAEK
jgi:hypothetical protein